MQADPNDQTSPEALLAEAEAMIWALLDDQLDEADVVRLEQLLTNEESIRRRYAECVRLHADLTEYFSPRVPGTGDGEILNQIISENLPAADGARSPLSD